MCFSPLFRSRFALLVSFPLAFMACGDEGEPSLSDAAIVDGSVVLDGSADPDAGRTPDADPLTDVGLFDAGSDAVVVPLPVPPKGLVVVHGDYQTTSVSLSDLSGAGLLDDCIHSGSATAGLTLALSGDVVLPSQRTQTGEVVLIDRSNAVLTFLDPNTCAVNRQLNVGTGFKSNPYDYLQIAPDRAYITRFDANANPTTSDFDEGSDILIVNPETKAIVGRIDLQTVAPTPVMGTKILPRPDRLVALGGKVYVSLKNLSVDFSVATDGRIAIINPTTNQTEGFLSVVGLQNCGELKVAGPETLSVVCAGAFSSGTKQIDFSGIMHINVVTGAAEKVMAGAFGRPLSSSALAGTEDQFFAVTNGAFAGPPPDQLWTGRFGALPPSVFFNASGGFVLGTLLMHPTLPLLLVADASVEMNKTPLVRTFNVTTSPPTAAAPIPVGGKKRMPIRSLAWF